MVVGVVTHRYPSRPISTSKMASDAVRRTVSFTTAVPSDVSVSSRTRWSLYAPNIRWFRDGGRRDRLKNAALVGAIVGTPHHAIGITGLGPSRFVLAIDGGIVHVAEGPQP